MYVSVCALELRMDAPLGECILRERVTYHSVRGLASLDSGGSLSKSNDTLRINLGNRRSLLAISRNMMTPCNIENDIAAEIPMISNSCGVREDIGALICELNGFSPRSRISHELSYVFRPQNCVLDVTNFS